MYTLAATCSCEDTCNVELEQFSTPNYPDIYGDDAFCSYHFSVPDGKAAMITWLEFDVEDFLLSSGCWDIVRVRLVSFFLSNVNDIALNLPAPLHWQCST